MPMKKLLLSLFFLILSHTIALVQDPVFVFDAAFSYNLDFQQLEKDKSDQLFLMLLYNQYRENIVYKNAPYKGVSFQMNRLSTLNKSWSEVNFCLGAFTQDFKETGRKEVGGVLFNYPVYMGWNFKLYNHIHFSTGATFLERRYFDNNISKTRLISYYLGITGKFPINMARKNF
jgi:hypothetical protein